MKLEKGSKLWVVSEDGSGWTECIEMIGVKWIHTNARRIPVEAFWYAPYTKPSRKITVWASKEACISHETLYPVYTAFTRRLEYNPESMTVDGVYAAAKLLGVDMSDV